MLPSTFVLFKLVIFIVDPKDPEFWSSAVSHSAVMSFAEEGV